MSENFHLQDAQFSEQTIAVLATHDASSTTTGSLLTSGGLGVKLSAHIGETLHVNSVNVTPSLGDIVAEREQPLSNNVSSPASISDFVFYNDSTRTFVATVSVHVQDDNVDKNAVYTLHGTLQANNWFLNSSYTGDVTGVKFSIHNTSIGPRSAGQILYTNSNTNGTSTIRFKANTISPTGASNDAGPYASTPVSSSNTTFSPSTANNWNNVHTDVSSALDELADRLASGISFTNELHVSKSGSDTIGNGSFERPYLSITAAINAANSLPDSDSVAVHVHPGVYTENVVLIKPKMSLIGNTTTFSNACQINGTVTINPRSPLDSVYNNIFTLENFLVTKNTGTAIVSFTGSNAGYLYISNCKLWTSGAPHILHYSNTSSISPRFQIRDTQLHCSNGSGKCLEIASGCNAIGSFNRCELFGNSNVPLVLRSSQNTMSANTSNVSFNHCTVEGNATFLADVQNASVGSFLHTTLTNYSIDSSGINVGSNGVTGTYYCTFSIPTNTTFPTSLTPPNSTTGYIVKGTVGSMYGHGAVTFVSLMSIGGTMHWTTNKYSNSMTTFASQTLASQA